MIHNDYASLPDRRGLPPGHAAVVRELTVPILRGRQVVAIIGVGNKEGPYGPEDVRVVQQLGSMVMDQVERKRAADELRASEEKFARLFHLAPVMIALTTLDEGRFIEVNEALLRHSGFTAAELIGRTSAEVGWIGSEERAKILAALADGERITGLELTATAKGGRRVDCLFGGEIVNLGGQRQLLSMAVDTSERRKLEQQLRQAQKMEAVGQLAGGVAHDFNNILAAIMMNVGLLREEPGQSEEVTGMLKELEAEAARAASLTRQLLAFSRRQPLQPRPVHLPELVNNLLRMLRRLLGENIVGEVRAPEGLPAVEADPGMIEQVVLNLCVNARDAMPRGGRIDLTLAEILVDSAAVRDNPEARAGRHVCIQVVDNGCGMSDETRQHLFEPFFTTKEPGKGTGLGLATVYGIVRQHGGWVEVESEPARGSTFRVFLPALAAALAAEGLPAAGLLPRGQGEILLVVEDEATVRSMLGTTLRRFGYGVLEAANGPAALELWRNRRDEIALVLTDMVMPGGLGGVDVVKQLRADRPGLRIIAITGYVSSHADALPEDVTLLAKPFDPSALLTSIRRKLDAPATVPAG